MNNTSIQMGTTMVGGLGFGCYRVSHTDLVHLEAMRWALAQGVARIDTSSNYGNGGSELLVGKVLASTSTEERPTVVTKYGSRQCLRPGQGTSSNGY